MSDTTDTELSRLKELTDPNTTGETTNANTSNSDSNVSPTMNLTSCSVTQLSGSTKRRAIADSMALGEGVRCIYIESVIEEYLNGIGIQAPAAHAECIVEHLIEASLV